MLEGRGKGRGVGEGKEEEAEPGAISPTARSERNGGVTNSPALRTTRCCGTQRPRPSLEPLQSDSGKRGTTGSARSLLT